MLTRLQKEKEVSEGLEALKKSDSLVLIDFDGLPTADLKNLRLLLRDLNSKLKIIKKRLLKIVLEKGGVAVDPTQFESQVGTIFAQSDVYGFAGKINKFIKELAKNKKELKVLSVFDLKNKRAIGLEEFNAIAKLPSKEILLAQVAMMITVPIKKLLIVLNSRKSKLE